MALKHKSLSELARTVISHVYWLDLLIIVLPTWGLVVSFAPPIRATVGLILAVSWNRFDVVEDPIVQACNHSFKTCRLESSQPCDHTVFLGVGLLG